MLYFLTESEPSGFHAFGPRGSQHSSVRPSRGVAQPGRAPGSGPGGRRFKSSRPDQLSSIKSSAFPPFATSAKDGAAEVKCAPKKGGPARPYDPQTAIAFDPEQTGLRDHLQYERASCAIYQTSLRRPQSKANHGGSSGNCAASTHTFKSSRSGWRKIAITPVIQDRS